MKNKKTFQRKIIYFVLIAVLLLPLSFLSSPRSPRSAGGLLSQMREEHELSQANLGEIDPTSESVKLATLGLRGVAANYLWKKADYFKKTEDWDNLTATLEQMIKLQPNYISVWKFQAWNLSYNVSVEFDDHRQRYHWVKKGIGFLFDGMDYNVDAPRLLWDTGWFFGHKLGRSDERYQYRRMFKTDEEFHEIIQPELGQDLKGGKRFDNTMGPQNLHPDTWKVSHEWFKKAQDVVDTKDKPLTGQSPLIFHSDPAMSRIRYAEAIEEDGFHGEVGQRAWYEAGDELNTYGNRQIPTSWNYDIQLNDGKRAAIQAEEAGKQFEEFLAGIRDDLIAKKVAARTPTEQAAYNTPVDERTDDQHTIMQRIKHELEVSNAEVAEAAPLEKRVEAKRLAFDLSEKQDYATAIRRYRQIVNFDYWETRCEVEQRDEAVAGRKFIYDAVAAQRAAKWEEARGLFEQAWEKWAVIFEKYPSMMDDIKSDDLMDAVKRYRNLVELMEDKFPPPDFKLTEFVKLHDKDMLGLEPESTEATVPTEPTEQDASNNDDSTDEDATEDSEDENTSDEQPTEENSAEQSNEEKDENSDESPKDSEDQPADTDDQLEEEPSDGAIELEPADAAGEAASDGQ